MPLFFKNRFVLMKSDFCLSFLVFLLILNREIGKVKKSSDYAFNFNLVSESKVKEESCVRSSRQVMEQI